MAQAAIDYDPRSALYAYAPGLLLTHDLEDALVAAYIANGKQPLTSSQVLAITGPAPAPLTSIPWMPPE